MARRLRWIVRAILVGLALPGSGCAAPRPAWLEAEEAACFRVRGFSTEIPDESRGDPLRDPCWRWRGGGDRRSE